ncbi:MAG: hypothetical protein IPG09_15650 [Ignavibacteria bacterium]|nr:hypothetical protein [Ignavibacteria bacterium]
MYILINKSTDIEDLFAIFNSERRKKKPKPMTLIIDPAKHFPMDRIIKLGNCVSGSKLEIYAMALSDIDFTELVFTCLCSTTFMHVKEGFKINMVSISQLSKDDLSKVAKLISMKASCHVEEIIKGYENQSIIFPDVSLTHNLMCTPLSGCYHKKQDHQVFI